MVDISVPKSKGVKLKAAVIAGSITVKRINLTLVNSFAKSLLELHER